jgi:hypothetical protein
MKPNVSSPVRVEAPRPILTLPNARTATHVAPRVPSAAPFQAYGAVQSPADEREAALLDVAVLGYN